ncbi:MAG: hypothetical protein JW910_15200 [Anaerolineae bacterium]|nr:hypothetical protein [Anaerolineae bacterium]
MQTTANRLTDPTRLAMREQERIYFLSRPHLIIRQQTGKPCLCEMVIGSEGLGNLLIAHHDKADAVNQSPVFIEASLVEVPSPQPQTGVHRHDGCFTTLGACQDSLHPADAALFDIMAAEGVADFQQHRFSVTILA